ncbi:MAG TPA: DNRLRE domain-containing protein [Actinomycetota bacterium]|nr:DNRLRE domain-containing protein [Actinomycetota bacterium]
MKADSLRRAALTLAVAVTGMLLPTIGVNAQGHGAEPAEPARPELVGRRTQTSKTYLNPDGTLTTTLFSGPVHYDDGRGNWEEIQDELVPTDSGPFAIRNGKNAFDVAFKPDVEEGFLRFGTGQATFDFTLEGAARAGAQNRGRGVSYGDVMPGVDLEYELLPDGLKETLVLRGPNVPTTYRFVMAPASGVSAEAVELPSGSWEVYADGIEPSFTFSAPVVMEAPAAQEEPVPTPMPGETTPAETPTPAPETPTPAPVSSPDPSSKASPDSSATTPASAETPSATESPVAASSTPEPMSARHDDRAAASERPASPPVPDARSSQANAHLDVRPLGNGRLAIELSVDPQWLHDPERRFPVLLDPTIQIPTSAEDASYAMQCETCGPTLDRNLRLGTDNQNVWRDAIKFDVQGLPTDQITAAELQLWHDGSCLGGTVTCSNVQRTLEVYRLTKVWNTSSVTSQIEWDPTLVDSYVLAAGSANVSMEWNVTQVVKDWVKGVSYPHGFLVKQAQEVLGSSGGILPYGRRHSMATRRPQLHVTYADVPVTLNQVETVHSNGAELSWTPYASASGQTFQKYEVHRSQDPRFVPNDASTLVATMTDETTTTFVDSTAAPGKSFTYRIVVNDDYTSNARTVTTPAAGLAVKYLQEEPSDAGQDTTLVFKTGEEFCFSQGRVSFLNVGASPTHTYRSLLRFDLGDVPAGAVVRNSKLSLTQPPGSSPSNNRSVTVEVHRATTQWDQGFEPTNGCNGRGATWYTFDGTNAWANVGGDFDSAVESGVTIAPGSEPAKHALDLTALTTKWFLGQTPNFGIVLKAWDETLTTGNATSFYSADSTLAGLNQDQRPTLEVTYEDGSQSSGPSGTLTRPLANQRLRGTTETLSATVTDDGRVDQVEFLVEGNVVGTDISAPYSTVWNSTGVGNGTKTFQARARDDAGNVTTSPSVLARVENSAPPSVTLTAPAPGATVSGTVSLSASASDDGTVSRVEFLVDGYLIGTDSSVPYQASWDTLGTTPPSYDGPHQISAVAYDDHLQPTTSSATVTVANASGTRYSGTFGNPAVPREVLYEPPTCGSGGNQPCPQPVTALDVSVKNTSAQAWSGSDIVLRYRWLTPSGTVVATGPDTTLPATIAPGVDYPPERVDVSPPALDAGIDRAQFLLRVDLFEKSTNTWFATKGNKPVEEPVIVHKQNATDMLGLERYFQYSGMPLGAGMGHLVNLASGNSLLRWTPFSAPGRGLSTVLDLTYNSLEDKTESPAGNNISVAISSLTRFGHPLDVHPNNADTNAGNTKRAIRFTDGDGTTHEFTGKQAADGTVYWEEPTGVHLWLRSYSTTNAARKWALTRPDGITFFYNADGYPTSVEDRNGNKLAFELEAVPPAEDPGGLDFRIKKVTDAAGVGGASNRSFTVDYYTKDEVKKPQVRGKIERITDHDGSALVFDYYDDGNLLRLTQKGGLKADGSPLADRSFVFTYTNSAGNGPAIGDAGARSNPDPKTAPQSTRLFSVRDPRGAETRFAYLGSGNGLDRWKLASVTDRAGKQTSFAYGGDGSTTVTAPMNRTTKYTFDTDGKVTSILDPKGQTTSVFWNAERHVSRVEEPGGGVTKFDHNANGYLTDRWDQLNRHVVLTYDHLAVRAEGGGADSRDAPGYWKGGRSIPHMSELASVTDARGNVAEFDYDSRGNVGLARDEEGFETLYTYDPNNGNLTSVTDALTRTTRFFDYDANGFPQTVENPMGHTTRMTYDDDGLLRSVRLPRNSSKAPSVHTALLFDYDAFHRLGRQSEPKSSSEVIWSGTDYDPNDNVVLSRSPKEGKPGLLSAAGSKTTLSYDPMDRMFLSAGPEADQKIGYTYDDAGRVATITSPRGMETATIDDFATTFTYDALDRITKTSRWTKAGSTASSPDTRYDHLCYDTAGDVVARVAPRAARSTVDCAQAIAGGIPFTTRHTYDAAHQLRVVTRPDAATRSFTYDENGNLKTVTDERNALTELFYDRRNMVFKVERPFNGTRKVTSRTFYDAVGNVSKEVSPRAFDLSDGTNFTHYVTEYAYDGANRLARVDLPAGPGEPHRLHVFRDYDADGNLKVTTLPTDKQRLADVPEALKTTVTYFSNGWMREVDDHVNPKTTYDYTAEGWQKSRSLATGVEERWKHFPDGTLKRHVDRDGQSVEYVYDANNNVKEIFDHAGKGNASTKGFDLRMTYDDFDQLASVKQNEEGRSDDAGAEFTTYTYDHHGNALTRVDDGVMGSDQVIRGRKHTFSYDEVDWLKTHWDEGENAGCTDDQLVTTTFFRTGWQETRKIYRVAGACPATPTDSSWQLKQETSWDYFASGDLRTLTTKAAGQVRETHTVDYTDVVDGKNVYVNGHRVKDQFTLKSAEPGADCQSLDPVSQCVSRYTYDPRDRLVRHDRSWAAPTTWVVDPAGNVTTETRGATTKTSTYAGTRLERSIVEENGQTTSARYVYEPEGTLGCVVRGGYTGDKCPDPSSGNLITHYEYDYLERIASVAQWGGNATRDAFTRYDHDVLDRPESQREVHGTRTKRTVFTYVGLTDMVAKEQIFNSDTSRPSIGNVTKTYSYDPLGTRISMTNTPAVDNSDEGGKAGTYTYGYDVHGSVSQLIDSAGNVKAAYGYHAYGNPDGSLTKGELQGIDQLNPYRYSGRRLDTGSGTIDMGARRFSPDTGRFLQPDVFQGALSNLGLSMDPLSGNRYSLASGNPVSFVEVDGHMLNKAAGGGAKPSPTPYPLGREESLLGSGGVPDRSQPHADVVTAHRTRPEKPSNLSKLWGGLSDVFTGYDILDHADYIAKWARRAGVDARTLMAVLAVETDTRQTLPGNNILFDIGIIAGNGLKNVVGRGEPSIGYGQIQPGWLGNVSREHPEVLQGGEIDLTIAPALMVDSGLGIRAVAFRLKRLQAEVRAVAPDSLDYYEQQLRVAAAYNSGTPRADARAGDITELRGGSDYAWQIVDEFMKADRYYCKGAYWDCTGY